MTKGRKGLLDSQFEATGWGQEHKVTWSPQSGSREGGVLGHFLLFIQSKAPVQGMVPPTFGEGLLNFISSIWKVPHRHTQMWGEDEVLNKWIFLT